MRLAPRSDSSSTSRSVPPGKPRRQIAATARLHYLRQRRRRQKRLVRLFLKRTLLVVLVVVPIATLVFPSFRWLLTREFDGAVRLMSREVNHVVDLVRFDRKGRSRSNAFIDTASQDLSPELRALLDTIAFAEGTHDALGYQTIFTFDEFSNFSDHPRQVRCAKYYGQHLCSDAAGRYQMLSSTYDSVVETTELTDFSPQSQDLAAVELIRRRGGLEKIEAGDFDGAMKAIQREWASLPGSGHGQPEVTFEELRAVYEQRLEHYRRDEVSGESET
ncbi:glycoside hydrolase family 24 protein [Baaleninema sp.]|uniref:glycoside hydrolase family 24 protein n=1 Tax=Baaleninema sp. TaxID=3101197 RepID=UPI003D05F902